MRTSASVQLEEFELGQSEVIVHPADGHVSIRLGPSSDGVWLHVWAHVDKVLPELKTIIKLIEEAAYGSEKP